MEFKTEFRSTTAVCLNEIKQVSIFDCALGARNFLTSYDVAYRKKITNDAPSNPGRTYLVILKK